ncbi:PREDICTED: squamosa promoter-binding-like protein 13A [Tarenaya hassleriana]|uniref:squamosa promoter-binding-like protein 13A n=1 Tax=Tarenaya hassleriana TaxID=28532 RepID=UPI00053C3FD3|nr:PREDICTED: squamosa promoter-binding-like protein 13A [Tarenaya hassleriana]XP_010536615.1 PREDICTED: squamosa promoter-binding-like protein 13A [Tarenaya hassleriana]XP_010536616.1 PREDICTED: squamosa promoter-binding-like protein 13A [Tarenaya hassleriana]
MDWSFNKQSSGYVSELYQEPVPDIPHIGESIPFGSPSSNKKGEFSFDLQLGNVGNSYVSASGNNNDTEPLTASGGKWKEAKPESSSSWSRSGPLSKRSREIGDGTRTPFCVVDGCDSNLSNCREYHRRHKVCEVHSKTPAVTINGRKLRFCQQCSRFHSLEEFDEGKRSCRKRLDGHNRRRRKHQPDPDPVGTRPSSFSSSFRDTKLTQLSGLQVLTTMAEAASPGWRSSHNNRKSDSTRWTSWVSDSDCALSLLSSSSSSHHENVLQNQQQPRTRASIPLAVQSLPYLAHEPFVSYGSDGSVVSGNGSVSVPRAFPFHWE